MSAAATIALSALAMTAIVGLHFLPLARVMQWRGHRIVGIGMLAVALAGMVMLLFGASVAPDQYWVYLGAAAMALMFQFASIPLMDERSAERRPAYREHMQKVSALVPWPPKR